MNWKLLLLWLLPALPGWAQPGGGGGLDIAGLYGRKGNRLVRLDSASVQVRQFVLADAAALAAYRAGRPYRPAWYAVVDSPARSYSPPRPSRRLRSLFDTYGAAVRQEAPVSWHPKHYDGIALRLPDPEPQRLYLVYRADTMVLDVSNLPEENPMGGRAQLDSLVVMPGYFHLSFVQRPAPGTEIINRADTLGNWQWRRGFLLTPSRVAGLRATRYLTYRPAGPSARQLPAPAVLHTWRQAYQQAYFQFQYQQALATIAQAQAAGVLLHDARTYLLQADCYRELHQLQPIEQLLTQALDLTPSRSYQNPAASSDLRTLRTIYDQRLQLRLSDHRYPQTLADYDSLMALRIAELRYSAPANLDELLQNEQDARLAFLTGSLHEYGRYRATMEQLRTRLEPHLTRLWRSGAGLVDMEQLNQLANAEYQCGEFDAAYQHWQLLLLTNYGYSVGYTDYFTGLLAQQPYQTGLLLCRALAYVGASRLGPVAQAQSLRAAALRDLHQAERLRPQDFRVNYFRAKLYEVAGQRVQAVAEVDRAIAKETTMPALYRLREELLAELK